MAIDPELYKKYSGLSGDPMAKLGAALAQSSARRQRNRELRDRSVMERLYTGRRDSRMVVAVFFAIVLIVFLISLAF